MAKSKIRIITRIRMDDNGGQISTFIKGVPADRLDACETRSVVFAFASICRDSPLGFEGCMEKLSREVMRMSRMMGKKA